jgi:hypothetical protein
MSSHNNNSGSDDQMLDPFFEAARSETPVPSEDFLARLAHDAAVVQRAAARPSAPLWSQALSAIGGWFGAGGLAAATLAGFYIGFVDADLTLVQGASDDLVEFVGVLPDDMMFFEEG